MTPERMPGRLADRGQRAVDHADVARARILTAPRMPTTPKGAGWNTPMRRPWPWCAGLFLRDKVSILFFFDHELVLLASKGREPWHHPGSKESGKSQQPRALCPSRLRYRLNRGTGWFDAAMPESSVFTATSAAATAAWWVVGRYTALGQFATWVSDRY